MATSAGRSAIFTPPTNAVIIDVDSDDEDAEEMRLGQWVEQEQQTRRTMSPPGTRGGFLVPSSPLSATSEVRFRSTWDDHHLAQGGHRSSWRSRQDLREGRSESVSIPSLIGTDQAGTRPPWPHSLSSFSSPHRYPPSSFPTVGPVAGRRSTGNQLDEWTGDGGRVDSGRPWMVTVGSHPPVVLSTFLSRAISEAGRRQRKEGGVRLCDVREHEAAVMEEDCSRRTPLPPKSTTQFSAVSSCEMSRSPPSTTPRCHLSCNGDGSRFLLPSPRDRMLLSSPWSKHRDGGARRRLDGKGGEDWEREDADRSSGRDDIDLVEIDEHDWNVSSRGLKRTRESGGGVEEQRDKPSMSARVVIRSPHRAPPSHLRLLKSRSKSSKENRGAMESNSCRFAVVASIPHHPRHRLLSFPKRPRTISKRSTSSLKTLDDDDDDDEGEGGGTSTPLYDSSSQEDEPIRSNHIKSNGGFRSRLRSHGRLRGSTSSYAYKKPHVRRTTSVHSRVRSSVDEAGEGIAVAPSARASHVRVYCQSPPLRQELIIYSDDERPTEADATTTEEGEAAGAAAAAAGVGEEAHTRQTTKRRGEKKLRGSLGVRRSPRVELLTALAASTKKATAGRVTDESEEDRPLRGARQRTASNLSGNRSTAGPSLLQLGGRVKPRSSGQQSSVEFMRDQINAPLMNDLDARRIVKNALREFNAIYLRSIQEEEARVKRDSGSARPDLRAFSKMRELGTIINTKRVVGHVAGVRTGDRFYARSEMCAIGLHPSLMNGIGVGKAADTGRKVSLAIAIVLSGGYEDDLDKGEELVYTGEGGNDLVGGRGQVRDQDPDSCGNKGMKNSMELGEPVRVIRGHKSPNTLTKRVYTYDGLYKVIDSWSEFGVSGFRVIKFRLKRLENQPPLTTDLVEFRPKSTKFTPTGVVCEDLADGSERTKVVAVNTVDDPPVPPPEFQYITNRIELQGLVPHVRQRGCSCKDKCTDPSVCECARKNGGSFPYVKSGGPRLVRAKSVVYECGPNCSCGPDCLNRTTQQGLQYRLEVFKTEQKGWGLRSWNSIPAGSFVCEYAGRVLKDTDGEKVDCDEYLFDLDLIRIMKYSAKSRWGDVSDIDTTDEHYASKLSDLHDDNVDYCMDASKAGNVSRFANHSCSPNMFVQCVLHDHHDLELPHICLFAGEHIPALQELTYDYAYEVNSVMGKDGVTHNHRNCFCGALDCRGVLY